MDTITFACSRCMGDRNEARVGGSAMVHGSTHSKCRQAYGTAQCNIVQCSVVRCSAGKGKAGDGGTGGEEGLGVEA